MLPQEWTALLGVTQVTGVIDSGPDQQGIVLAGVRVMAVRAGHRAETKRVTAGLEGVGTGAGMAGKTYFLLR